MMTSPTAPSAAGKSDDWPTFNAELSRKTTEQLQTWSDRYDRGVIPLSTMICVVSVLYDTTSGMIDRDLSTLIANIHRDLLLEAQKPR